MGLFKRKNPPPLKQAIDMVHQAIEIAYEYQRDKQFIPHESDIALFERLREALWSNHATAEYITRCMRQRMNGEAEGAKKFTNTKVFDYHYPP